MEYIDNHFEGTVLFPCMDPRLCNIYIEQNIVIPFVALVYLLFE
jgi:hypothetical protein